MSVQCISVSNKRHFHVSVVKVEVEVEVEAAVVYRVTHLQMLITILHCGFEEEMSLRLIVRNHILHYSVTQKMHTKNEDILT